VRMRFAAPVIVYVLTGLFVISCSPDDDNDQPPVQNFKVRIALPSMANLCSQQFLAQIRTTTVGSKLQQQVNDLEENLGMRIQTLEHELKQCKQLVHWSRWVCGL
jgi:hypothetical protein